MNLIITEVEKMITIMGSAIVIAIGVFLIMIGIRDLRGALPKMSKPEPIKEVVEDNSEVGSVSK